ncbi:2'-5' RNA ligase family protein [Georgenia sp. AZ-5]|uniref:2'-5' RNA ligase family protein n=1 Tax=Georgenia sp. AZ-5 TaxID=3367526 RepID=UPI0037551E1A
MRLFVALPLPRAVQEHLDLVVSAMMPSGDPGGAGGPHPVRWVPLEQRHITLAFYGEVPDGAVPALAADLTGELARHAPMRLRLGGAGTFSRRTLWVGVHVVRDEQAGDGAPDASREDVRSLIELMAACEDVGESYARIERRDRHRAHVTIGRLSARRPAADELADRAHALSVYSGPVWTATHAELLSSQPGAGRSGGPLYEVVERLPLGGAPAPPAPRPEGGRVAEERPGRAGQEGGARRANR